MNHETQKGGGQWRNAVGGGRWLQSRVKYNKAKERALLEFEPTFDSFPAPPFARSISNASPTLFQMLFQTRTYRVP